MSIFNAWMPLTFGVLDGAVVSKMCASLQSAPTAEKRSLNQDETEQKRLHQGYQRAFTQAITLVFSGWYYLHSAANALGKPLSNNWRWSIAAVSATLPFIASRLASSSKTQRTIRSIANFAHVHLEKISFLVSVVSLGILAVHGQTLYVGVILGSIPIKFVATYLKKKKGKLATLGSIINFISTVFFNAAVIYRVGWIPGAFSIINDVKNMRRIPSDNAEVKERIDKPRIVLEEGERSKLFDPAFNLPKLDLNKTDLRPVFDRIDWGNKEIQEKLFSLFTSENMRDELRAFYNVMEESWKSEGISKEEMAARREKFKAEFQDQFKMFKSLPDAEKLSVVKEFVRTKIKALCDHCSYKLREQLQTENELPLLPQELLYLPAYIVHSIQEKSGRKKISQAHTMYLIDFAITADMVWSEKSKQALLNTFMKFMQVDFHNSNLHKLPLQVIRETLLFKILDKHFPNQGFRKFDCDNLLREDLGLSSAPAAADWPWSQFIGSADFNPQKIQEIINEFRASYSKEYRQKALRHYIFLN